MIGYYYEDCHRRDVLHVPKLFVLIGHSIIEPEVTLDPNRLQTRLGGLMRVIENNKRELELIEIEDQDAKTIIDLCNQGEIDEAEDYCIDIYDNIVLKLQRYSGDNSEFDPELGYDLDGFDPKYRDSFFKWE